MTRHKRWLVILRNGCWLGDLLRSPSNQFSEKSARHKIMLLGACTLNPVPILSPYFYIFSSYLFSRQFGLCNIHFHLTCPLQQWSMCATEIYFSYTASEKKNSFLSISKLLYQVARCHFIFISVMQFLCLSEVFPCLTNASPEADPRDILPAEHSTNQIPWEIWDSEGLSQLPYENNGNWSRVKIQKKLHCIFFFFSVLAADY